MAHRIGIRREDKNPWERRAPLTPNAVLQLSTQGVEVEVERFERRAFPDAAYAEAGAVLVDDVRDCPVVLGIKEMPTDYFRPAGAYVFFSHTIKGQPYNMEMLRRLVERGCTLLDYEKVTDADMTKLSEAVAKRIESELQYPGQIKVVVVRETRAIDFAR